MVEEIVEPVSLVGQKRIWQRLRSSLVNDRIPAAYLFHGPAGVGKEGYAIQFASLLNCHKPSEFPCGTCPSCVKFKGLQHPNMTLIVPLPMNRRITKDDPPLKALSKSTLALLMDAIAQKGRDPYSKINIPKANTILLSSIREVREKVYLKAAEEGRKMILVFDAHRLMTNQAESANALLKVLEEPPAKTTFILVTDYPQRLAETIRSRCRGIYFPPVPDDILKDFLIGQMQKDETEAILISHLCQGSARMARSLATEDLEEMDRLVASLIEWATSETASGWGKFLNHGVSVYRADPQEFSFHLQLVTYWFRDAMHFQKLNGHAKPILRNSEKEIRQFAGRFPSARYAEIISSLQTCVDSLSRNFNLNLVLINLLLDIRENLKGLT